MRYRSTRGGETGRAFADVLLDGIASDGGLYVPEAWPSVQVGTDGYAATAAAVMAPFVSPDPVASVLGDLATSVYSRFRHPDVAPLRRVGDRHILELFWGPTLSFKDYALGMVAALFDQVLARDGRRMLLLGATSGDTGSAAIEACRGRPGIDIVVLYPEGLITEVQRRQMTTVPDSNIHAVAVDGTFDDCQRLVKAAFTDPALRDLGLGAINSINWARVMAQMAYYVWAAGQLDQPARFVVPTGNFGNVLAGWAARRAGAPIAGLVVANNANHGLADLVATGRLEVTGVSATVAPAMDIQIPSNLERYLFELAGGDPAFVIEAQRRLEAEGQVLLDPELRRRMAGDFTAAWRADSDVIAEIARAHDETGMMLDPHTAVAWSVARSLPDDGPVVVIATAHPAKFPEVVHRAIGSYPEEPPELTAALAGEERISRLPCEPAALGRFLRELA